MMIVKTLLFIWQLPQNLLGLLVCKIEMAYKMTRENISYYETRTPGYFMRGCAVSLGEYIIVHDSITDLTTLKHENGHRKQSRIMGPLYLLLIGIPSVIGNLIDRYLHGSWTLERRNEWYYRKLPWERSADRLGDVKDDERIL